MPLLEFQHVCKEIKSRRRGLNSDGRDGLILSNISLHVNGGECVGLIGESGAGKSTIAAIAAGMQQPTSGSVTIDGQPVATLRRSDPRRLARAVQLLWQDAAGSLDPRVPAGAAIAEALRLHGMRDRAAAGRSVAELMEEVGLDHALAWRYPHELSGGEAQRVAIARALALDPELLICDEPAAALDAIRRARLADLLERLREERKLACVVVAHDLALVRDLTSRVYVLLKGEIVESGPTDEVLERPSHSYTRKLLDTDPAGWLQALTKPDVLEDGSDPGAGFTEGLYQDQQAGRRGP